MKYKVVKTTKDLVGRRYVFESIKDLTKFIALCCDKENTLNISITFNNEKENERKD